MRTTTSATAVTRHIGNCHLMVDNVNQEATFLNMDSTTATWIAFVQSRVYEGKINEDGERPDQLVFYVVCENPRGERFASHLSFRTEGPGDLWMHSEEAKRLAHSLCTKVTAALVKGADPSTSNKWSPTDPCYGSEAYGRGECELEHEARELEAEAGGQEADRFRAEVGL